MDKQATMIFVGVLLSVTGFLTAFLLRFVWTTQQRTVRRVDRNQLRIALLERHTGCEPPPEET